MSDMERRIEALRAGREAAADEQARLRATEAEIQAGYAEFLGPDGIRIKDATFIDKEARTALQGFVRTLRYGGVDPDIIGRREVYSFRRVRQRNRVNGWLVDRGDGSTPSPADMERRGITEVRYKQMIVTPDKHLMGFEADQQRLFGWKSFDTEVIMNSIARTVEELGLTWQGK